MVVYVCLYAENGATLLVGICNSLPPLHSISVLSYFIFYKTCINWTLISPKQRCKSCWYLLHVTDVEFRFKIIAFSLNLKLES